MSSQHTKGPWRAGNVGASVVSDHPVEEMTGSDDVQYYGGHLIAESISKENRNIVIASPDLYEALVMVRDADNDRAWDGVAVIPGPARQKIDAAIAKAEGRANV